MGRVRKTLRWTFSFGGTGAGSPIAAESDGDRLLREGNELLRQQNDLISELTASPPEPTPDTRALLDEALRSIDGKYKRAQEAAEARVRKLSGDADHGLRQLQMQGRAGLPVDLVRPGAQSEQLSKPSGRRAAVIGSAV
jgi:hypothetical protein